MLIIDKPFNNKYSSRKGVPIQGIVMHIAEGSIGAIHNWAKSKNNTGASWHFAVSKTGQIFQYCPEEHAAWHAGLKWKNGVPYNARGVKLDINRLGHIVRKNKNFNPNKYTIGIEHEGYAGDTWTQAMYEADSELIIYLCQKHNIPMDRDHIIGHCHIDYIDRPNCPGAGLNWDKLFYILEDKTMWKEKYYKLKENSTSCTTKLQDVQEKIQLLQHEIEVLRERNKKLEEQMSKKEGSSSSGILGKLKEWLDTLIIKPLFSEQLRKFTRIFYKG